MHSLCPAAARSIGNRMNVTHNAELARLQEFNQSKISGVLMVLRPHLRCDFLFRSQSRHQSCFCDCVRQYFPKKTDFRNISHHALAYVTERLNNRSRKRPTISLHPKPSLTPALHFKCEFAKENR